MKKILFIMLGLGFFGFNSVAQEKGGAKSNSERKVKSNVGSNKSTKGGTKKNKSKKNKSNN